MQLLPTNDFQWHLKVRIKGDLERLALINPMEVTINAHLPVDSTGGLGL